MNLWTRFVGAVVLCLTACTPSWAQTGEQGIIVDERSYLPLPGIAIPIAKATPERLTWSPGGRHLLVHCADFRLTAEVIAAMLSGEGQERFEKLTASIHLYTLDTAKLAKIVTFNPRATRIDEVSYFASSGRAIYLRRDADPKSGAWGVKLVSTNVATGAETTRDIPSLKPDDELRLLVGKSTVTVADNTNAVTYSPELELRAQFTWQKGGAGGSFLSYVTESDTLAFCKYGDDAARRISPNGEIGEPIDRTQLSIFNFDGHSKAVPYSIESTSRFASYGDQAGMLWLVADPGKEKEGDPSRSLISADASAASLADDGKHVAYLHHGVPIVVEIASADAKLVRQAVAAAKRAEILSKAKQAGLALLMFSADNDDQLPPNDDQLLSKLNPYVKNEALLAGFVYTWQGGGSIIDIKDPANTPIGHYDGPGGRAQVYADGHVKWIPDN